jgi:hypothetical protein
LRTTKLWTGSRRLTPGKAEPKMYDLDFSSNAERLVAILLAVVIVAVLVV